MPTSHLLSSLLLTALLAPHLSGCESSQAAPPAVTAAAPGAALVGIIPSTDLTGASDETGAAAIGATESGPGARLPGSAPEPTGGDGTGPR